MLALRTRHAARVWALLLNTAMFCMVPALAQPARGADEPSSAPPKQPEPKSAEQEAVQQQVDTEVRAKTDELRKELIEEAVQAVGMTHKAETLLAGKEPDTKAVLAELENAIGKLELVVARQPDLAFAPVAVTSTLHDVVARTETVKSLVAAANEDLDDGRVQDARLTLDDLASELVVSVSRLPLSTYPAAIQQAAALISAGKTAEAREQIQTALNLIVVQELIYPLPWMRAQAMLEEAEKLAESVNRDSDQNARLSKLLQAARAEIEFGEALGYITEENSDPLYEQVEQIEAKTADGKSGKGFFNSIKSLVQNLL